MDRADGEYGHREPSGYFRLTMPNAKLLPLRVQMRQSLYDATVAANITEATAVAATTAMELQPLLSLNLFVDVVAYKQWVSNVPDGRLSAWLRASLITLAPPLAIASAAVWLL